MRVDPWIDCNSSSTTPYWVRKRLGRYELGYLYATAVCQKALSRDRRTKHTTSISGITVLEPSPPNIGVLVVYAKVQIRDSLHELNASEDSRNTGSDYDNPQRASFINRPFFHNASGFLCNGLLNRLRNRRLGAVTEDTRFPAS